MVEVIFDFNNEDALDEDRERWIKAIKEGKKIKVDLTYFSDGDFNTLGADDIWFPSINFNTNSLVGLATEMGMEFKYEEPSEEEKEEIIKDLEENGPDFSFDKYIEDSKEDFI